MTQFSLMWGDVEDLGAGSDLAANAAFVQAGLDECAGRIASGLYGNEGSLQRIVGNYQFPGYPYDRASADGVPDANNVQTNGMDVTYEQFSLDRQWNGVAVDIQVRKLADGALEYGVDLSNFSGVPSAAWFAGLFDDANYPVRFIIFGDQMPFVTRAQVANAEAAGRAFDYQLYTYFNFPGGQFYAGRDGAQQMRDALDQMGVPQRVPAPVPATDEWSSFAVIASETFSVTIRKVS